MFCKECGKEIDKGDKFCKHCGHAQVTNNNNTVSNSFVNSGSGNQSANIFNKGNINNLKQYIGIEQVRKYENEKVSKNKVASLKGLGIGTIIATITTTTTLYLNIGKIFQGNDTATTVGYTRYSSLLYSISALAAIVMFALLILTIVLWKKGIIKIQSGFIDLTLVNIDNKIYKLKIKEKCPECKTEPKGLLKIREGNNGRYYVQCSKSHKHKFELDHTQF